MRIVFSKDRPAQLDLLLRSLERYVPSEATVVIGNSSTPGIFDGYVDVEDYHPRVRFESDLGSRDFNDLLRRELARADKTVTFFCDDDVVFRPIPDDPRRYLDDDDVLTFSWRLPVLGAPYQPIISWDWTRLPRTDHGYPGSIDGHTFRTADVLEMIGDQPIPNPTMLETALVQGCERLAERRPLMAAWPEQVLVGVPVNRVSDSSGCPNGQVYPQPVEELNARFLAGERIALDRLDFSGVTGCHHELQYVWE